MKKTWPLIASLLFVLMISCSVLQPAPPTPTPTATLTNTPSPTRTPRPTRTATDTPGPPDIYAGLSRWRDFTYTTSGNITTGKSPSGYTVLTIETSGGEVTKATFSMDMGHEETNTATAYLVVFVIDTLGFQYQEEVFDWMSIQIQAAILSLEDYEAERQFGNRLLTFEYKFDEGILVLVVTP